MKLTLTSIAALLALGAATSMPVPAAAQVGFNLTVGTPHVSIQFAPPAPRYERMPRHRRGYIWSPGYWQWSNQHHHHVWVSGSYMRAREGYMYYQPSWVQRDGGWYMEPSRWARSDRERVMDGHDSDRERVLNGQDRDRAKREGGYDRGYDRRDDRRDGRRDGPNGDRDGDGIRNGLDPRGGDYDDRDGDGIRNGLDPVGGDYDDADGDGVRNGLDRYRNDPRRH